MWGLILNVRLQIAQEFHILDDLGDSVLNSGWNTHQRGRAKEGQNNSLIYFMSSKKPVLLLKVYCYLHIAKLLGFVPCVHNPAGMSPTGKAHLRQIASPVFLLWLTHQPLLLPLCYSRKHKEKPGSCCWTPDPLSSPVGPTGQKLLHTEFPRLQAIWGTRLPFPGRRWQE